MRPSGSYFKAVLKTGDESYLEDGYARVSVQDRYVEFRNAFVPIMRLGETAKIFRVINQQETHCFTGQVYLSAPNLLRIVNVNDDLLAEAELEFMWKAEIKAKVSPVLPREGIFRLPVDKLLRFPVDIYSISMNKLKFTSTEDFLEDEEFWLTTDTGPHLKRILVRIFQLITFGQEKTGYRCEILSMPEASREALTEYLQKRNQVFPADEEPASFGSPVGS